jgi:tetratricopeptide (TPR) repeat protein
LYQAYLERNPLDPYTLNSLGSALCAANQLPQCLETRLRLLQLYPEYGGVNRSAGLALLYLGQFAKALAAMQREPNEDYRLAGVAMVYSAMGRSAESDSALHSLVEKFAARDAYGIAGVHAYRGEIDETFQWLDRAYRDHNFAMVGLRGDPLLRKLHDDQRFQALLSRMKLAREKQSTDAVQR